MCLICASRPSRECVNLDSPWFGSLFGTCCPLAVQKRMEEENGGSQTIEFGRIILSVCWESSPDLTGCYFGGSGSQWQPALCCHGWLEGSNRLLYLCRLWHLQERFGVQSEELCTMQGSGNCCSMCFWNRKEWNCSEKQVLLVNLIVPQINAAYIF